MHSEEFLKVIIDHIKLHQDFLDYNKKIFDIREGDLFEQLKAQLRQRFSGDSGITAAQRASPINILNKIIDKLSKLYAQPPTRKVKDGNETNQKLIDFYSAKANDVFHLSNENYNSYKVGAIEIFHDSEENELDFRALSGHQFLAYSRSRLNPLIPTDFIKIMEIDPESKKQVYWLYDKEHFTPFTDDKKIYVDDLGDSEGKNQYGILPFTYITRSRYLLVPMPDRDVLQMTLLLPELIADQNFGSMFLSHPVLYGIGVNADNLKLSPDHFWNVKPDKNIENPEVGVLRAEPDLEAMMNNVLNQLAMWLESRNIKASTIGRINGENFSSGISKLINEMDTIEDRKMQAGVFQKAETDFWRRVGIIHNHLAKGGLIANRVKFVDPEKLEIDVEYQEEKILEARADKVTRLKSEVEAGLNSRRKAIKELNPKMDDDQIDELINEIQEEKNGMATSEDQDTRGLQAKRA